MSRDPIQWPNPPQPPVPQQRETLEYYWTPKQLAERLQSSVDAVKRWMTVGELHFVKAGVKTLIPESAVQDFLHRSTERAADRKSCRGT
jgi:excisionase family DNA binding protein